MQVRNSLAAFVGVFVLSLVVCPALSRVGAEDATLPAAEEQKTPEFRRAEPSRPLRRLTSGELDRLLVEHGAISPDAPAADDAEFLRRATLDLIGRPPTPDELARLQGDSSPQRRSAVVERLLASPRYGDNWANYWSDVISHRTPQPELTFLDYRLLREWLAEQFNSNATWDETVYRLLTARGKVADNPAATFVGFHQADRSRLASETTRIFLGTQIGCAECHDHKFIDMPRETFHRFAAFFVRTEAKLPWNDSGQIEVKSAAKGEYKMPGGKAEMRPAAFDGDPVDLGTTDLERRAELAAWIVHPDNAWFAKAYVNRIWARLMGRGFCEPVDEIGELASAELPEVHAALAEHFAASGYDTKELMRLIVSTRGYEHRAVDLADASRRTALAATAALRGDEVFDSLVATVELPNVRAPAEKATDAVRFPPPPKSTRDLVNDAFGYDPSIAKDNVLRTMKQAMFLMNNQQLQGQVNGAADSGTVLARMLAEEPDDTALIGGLFVRVLAREPGPRELEMARSHIKTLGNRREAFEDLLWSLLNTAEFTTRY